jgi:hypothetical protein
MRVLVMGLCLVVACSVVQAKDKPVIDETGINMGSNYVYNLAYLDVAATSNDFTDAEVAHNAISVGQLVGVNPETGQMITNAVNLLPIMVRSAYVAGEVNAAWFAGNGGGLTNLNGGAIVGYIPIGAMPTSGVWNVSGLTFKDAHFEGPLSVGGQALEVGSDLNVQGRLSGDASGLSNVPAGGTDGSLQFNSEGRLVGNTNYFIHAETGKMAFRSKEGNLWRAYKKGTVADENLIYIVRRYQDTTELRLLSDGEDMIRLRGDGTAYIAGDLEVGGDVTFANGITAGNNNWYIPESGDLSMGGYVAGAGLAVAAGEYVPDASDLSMGSYTQQ